ncbi:hypothetical protein [Streptomyces sp. NPDC002067]
MDTAEQRVVRRAVAAAAVLAATLIMVMTCGNGEMRGHPGPAAPVATPRSAGPVEPAGTAGPPEDTRAHRTPTPYAS